MKAFISSVIIFCAPFSFASLQAKESVKDEQKSYEGFVQIEKEKSLYVQWTKAEAGQPTLILLNGLTYSTAQWERFTKALVKLGLGVVRYDMYGMGRTLLKDGPVSAPITYQNQVNDLNNLLSVLKIPAPYNLVGLSYGGGIAMTYSQKYSSKVARLFLMAPYTQPVEEQDTWIKSQIWLTKKMYPWNPSSYDDLYDYFLHQLVYSTYPSAEPVVLENPYKLEAVYRMVQGIRKWEVKEALSSFPKKSVHLMIAGSDQYIKRKVMTDFWESVPTKAKGSVVIFQNTEHKIPEAIPVFAAAWVDQILADPSLTDGTEYEADPATGVVRYEGGKFKLGKGN